MLPPPVSKRVADSLTRSTDPCRRGVSWDRSALSEAMELCNFRHRGSFWRNSIRSVAHHSLSSRRAVLAHDPGDWPLEGAVAGRSAGAFVPGCACQGKKKPTEVGPYVLCVCHCPFAGTR